MSKTKSFITVNGDSYVLRTSKVTFGTSPVHVSDSMSGKMEGIPSVSTACTVNPVCLARMQNGESICSRCFAFTTMKMRRELREALESNYKLLNSGILPDELLPTFGNVRFVRIESFGDLGSVTQAINYVRMIKKNPDVLFAWWTKNKAFAEQAFKAEGKPENLVFVESSFLMNQVEENVSEYAVRAWLNVRERNGGSRDYLRSVLSASAEIAGNYRVWNLWDETGTLDVWIECIAETDEGFLKLGFYLSDAWQVGSYEADYTLFCHSYPRYYTKAK